MQVLNVYEGLTYGTNMYKAKLENKVIYIIWSYTWESH